jgi:hypothetical protein
MMKIPMRIYFLGGCALLFTSIVSAYVLLSPTRTWQAPPTYIVDERGLDSISGDGGVSAVIEAITSADNAWNGAGSGTVVNAIAGDVSSVTVGDGIPMLLLRDPIGYCTGSCLALTFTSSYEQVGGRGRKKDKKFHIFDADILTNHNYDWTSESEGGCSAGEYFIEGVQVHEIGHGLGLGHSDVAGATMYPTVAACDNGPATIEGDDAGGLVALYGQDDSSGGGGSCALGQVGDSCSSNGQCCSGKCRGKPGIQSCR